MGKKTPSSEASTADPFSPTLNHTHPRMEPPPPYDAIRGISPRSSISSSVRSVDRLDPDNLGSREQQHHQQQQQGDGVNAEGPERGGETAQAPAAKNHCDMKDQGGGCMNHGKNVNGCMNYGDNSDGCMNYESRSGCMNYKSTGGCMNYEVDGDWEGNEGCMNYRRGGGCLLSAD